MGATASAAVGLTSTVTWLLGSISVAFGVGVLAVCAQSDGAKRLIKKYRLRVNKPYLFLLL